MSTKLIIIFSQNIINRTNNQQTSLNLFYAMPFFNNKSKAMTSTSATASPSYNTGNSYSIQSPAGPAGNLRAGFEYSHVWNIMRTEEKLCDGVIKLKNGDNIKIHRAILSACSRYFKACFIYKNNEYFQNFENGDSNTVTNDNNEYSGAMHANNSETEIFVDTDKNIMNLILDFAYTGTCSIDWVNIEDLLPAADKYGVVGLIRLCCTFLLGELQAKNAIKIYLFAKQYFCVDLIDLSKIFILGHFQQIIDESPELLGMSGDELYSLLVHDHLNVNDEEIVYETIKKWVEHDTPNRTPILAKLLPSVRFGLLKNRFTCQGFMLWPPIQESAECRKIVTHALAYLNSVSKNPNFNSSDPMSRPRIPYEIIMVVGGWTGGSPTNIIEVFDTRANCWLRMIKTDTRRAYHGICTIDHKMYVLGGFDGTTHFNSMRCYDGLKYIWEEKACMYHPRCYVSIVAHRRMIYAMGGYNGYARLDTVERYDPDRNQWEMLAPMNRVRSDAGAAALKEHIYIVGGFDGNEILSSCEMYNINTNQWTMIPFMLSPRSGVCLISCQDSIYAIGGFDGTNRLNSVEKYSDRNPRWQNVAEMMTPRSNFASVLIENLIYVIGGFNGNYTMSFVEIYDPLMNMWQAGTQMNVNRSAQAACVLRGLQNIQVYSSHANELPYSPCKLPPIGPNQRWSSSRGTTLDCSATTHQENDIDGMNDDDDDGWDE